MSSQFLLAADVYGLTAGRFWSLVAALIGLVGVLIGGLAVSRSRRLDAGLWRHGPVTALAAGLVGMAVGGLVVAAADGGPGTGYGIVGGYVALVVGLVAVALGGLTLTRLRRTG
jgi:peptidoglycan/LPS O-acetylase OafA/YrhL